MSVKPRSREPKAKGAAFAAATLPCHPSALSMSTSFFLENSETLFFTAQMAYTAKAKRRKRMMMMIAMVMLRLTILSGDDQQIVAER